MTTDLALASPDPPPLPALPAPSASIVEDWLAGLAPATVAAYRHDLDQFARWSGAESAGQAVEALLALPAGDAHGVALRYRNDLVARGLSAATVNRRLAALRSLVVLAGSLGRVSWTLTVRGPKPERRRDVRGPDRDDRRRLWRELAMGHTAARVRDRAILGLLFDCGLRRAELVELDLEHVDRAGPAVLVRGKGKRERARITLPPKALRDLDAWLAVRGERPGPLFVRLDARAGLDQLARLGRRGVWEAVGRVGQRAGLSRRLRPHGLRHAAITAALDAGEDVRTVRMYSRHSKIETVINYDDAREDHAGRVARVVSRERK